MEPDLLRLLLITFGAAVIADLSMALGVVPFFFIQDMSDRLTGAFSAAAAGMMAAASLVQLVGEGLKEAPGFQAWVSEPCSIIRRLAGSNRTSSST